jgi:hypothetical protein
MLHMLQIEYGTYVPYGWYGAYGMDGWYVSYGQYSSTARQL